MKKSTDKRLNYCVMLKKITSSAPAKINIFLEVKNKRPDGYHNISSVFCLVSLADEITLERIPGSKGEISFFCDKKELENSDNLVVKAAKKIISAAESPDGLKIFLRKKIPWGAGLGGASSDAAACLVAAKKLLNLKISNERLFKIGLSLGADVPFFLQNHPCARVDGIGEKIKPLPPFWKLCGTKKSKGTRTDITLLIVKPPFSMPTKEAYAKIKFPLTVPRQIDRIVSAIKSGKEFSQGIAPLFFNRFEEFIDEKLKNQISGIKKFLVANGAAAAVMSGSGSAVVGFFTNNGSAERTAEIFAKKSDLTGEIFLAKFGANK